MSKVRAFYYNTPDCRSCIDLGFDDIVGCTECMRRCKEEVDIIEMGTGSLGNMVVISDKNGNFKTVPITSLTIRMK